VIGLTNEQRDFLSLISCALNNKSIKIETPLNEEFKRIVMLHQCEPIIYQGSVNCGYVVPELWKYQTLYGALNNAKKLNVQTKVIKTLQSADIDCVILKGASVAKNYPVQGMRLLGDVDILVKEADYEKAVKLIFPDADLEQNIHDFHYGGKLNDVDIEIHKYITHNSGDLLDKKICSLMEDAIKHISLCEFEGHSFPVLDNKYQALVLLSHKKRHMDKNNLTLRMLCDWACFVKSIDCREWMEVIYPFLEKSGLHIFADVCNIFANQYLGAQCLDKVMSNTSDEVFDAFCDVVMSCGVNYKNKDANADIGSLFAKNKINSNKFTAFFKSINELARKQFSLAKHPVFLPIFWIYIPIRYFIRVLFGKRKPIKLSAIDHAANQRIKLYENLGL